MLFFLMVPIVFNFTNIIGESGMLFLASSQLHMSSHRIFQCNTSIFNLFPSLFLLTSFHHVVLSLSLSLCFILCFSIFFFFLPVSLSCSFFFSLSVCLHPQQTAVSATTAELLKKQEELERRARELERRERELDAHALGPGAGERRREGEKGRKRQG